MSEIRQAVSSALSRSDIVLVTGGLGPTFDDLTREGVAAALGSRLEYRPRLYARIRRKFRAYRHRRVPSENRRQAFVLTGARVLPNRFGSAPGQMLEWGKKLLFLLPGPPPELYPMMEHSVLPRLKERFGRGRVLRRGVLHLCGISESAADERLASLYRTAKGAGGGLDFTILSEPGLVDLHMTALGRSPKAAARLLSKAKNAAASLLDGYVFGEDEQSLESAVGERLSRRGQTLALAESCTGGLLSQKLTSVPGSSRYFLGGSVCYADSAKTRELEVPQSLLRRHGAVSAPCAKAMAEGIRRLWHSDWAVSITGIAGPGGGTKAKPVGTVFIAVAGPKRGARAFEFLFPGSREQIRSRAAITALTLLWRRLVDRP